MRAGFERVEKGETEWAGERANVMCQRKEKPKTWSIHDRLLLQEIYGTQVWVIFFESFLVKDEKKLVMADQVDFFL